MKLDLSYAEMSLLRVLVRKEQLNIWNTRWAPSLKKLELSTEQYCNIFDETMNKPLADWQPVATEEQCCKRLLDKFKVLEKDIQNILRSNQWHPPK